MRLLKKGGIIITSFISHYAPIHDALSYLQFDGNEDDVDRLLHYLENGVNENGNGFTLAYFTGIEEAQFLMRDCGLKQIAFAGVENVLTYKEQDLYKLSQTDFDKCIDLIYALSQDKNLLGASMHFLYVGQK
jgi:hypothetical protein